MPDIPNPEQEDNANDIDHCFVSEPKVDTRHGSRC